VIIVLGFLDLYSGVEARETRSGQGKLVDVVLAEGGGARTSTLPGTTGQFVNLYDDEIERVHIHPLESIHSISFQAD